MPENLIKLTLFYHGSNDNAICVSDDATTKKWIPLSQCEEIGEPFLEGEMPEIKITIPEWLAFEKYLI